MASRATFEYQIREKVQRGCPTLAPAGTICRPARFAGHFGLRAHIVALTNPAVLRLQGLSDKRRADASAQRCPNPRVTQVVAIPRAMRFVQTLAPACRSSCIRSARWQTFQIDTFSWCWPLASTDLKAGLTITSAPPPAELSTAYQVAPRRGRSHWPEPLPLSWRRRSNSSRIRRRCA